MAKGFLTLVVAASVQIFQTSLADSKIQDSAFHSTNHDKRATWSCQETFCINDKYHCSNENKGVAESLISDLHLKLCEAEFELKNPKNYPSQYDPKNMEEFDFIVVGAGTAGAVVANRLSEVESWKILLVEAGGNPPPTSEVPALAPTLQDTEIDWQYKTEREKGNCLGMEENLCKWPRGKVLGGSSVLNYMVHTRGAHRDFDEWARAGNKGWSYQEVLPYFKKSEDLKDPTALATEDAKVYHATGGLLSIERWPNNEDLEPAIEVIADGLNELGYPFNPDCNGKNLTGFTRLQGTLKDHRRCSTAKAFLSTATDRSNLHVTKHALATKILIDSRRAKAYGIQLMTKEGQYVEVHANKEVIVSAGAINSPQLLMLSGIGPKAHLLDLGIPLIKDLPVGKNLQDHPLMVSCIISTSFSFPIAQPDYRDTLKFIFKEASLLSSQNSFPYATYINTIPTVDWPDIELIQLHNAKNSKQNMIPVLKSFNFRDDVIENFVKINENAYSILILASMLRPYSRGSISLYSPDPNVYPRIVAGTFTDKRDIDTYLRTYDFISRLAETEALKRVDGKFHEIRLSDCEKYRFPSREHRECSMRHLTATTYHYSGTCKLGPAEDPTAVVDPTLTVHGVKGLRVVDASIMPTIPSAHINAPIIMIAEKAADMMKRKWGHV